MANRLSYKRRVTMLMAHECVINMEAIATSDWAIASLWIPAAQLVDGDEQATTLAAIHDAVGIKLLNDYGEIDMCLLDPSAMTDEQFIALHEALDEIEMAERLAE